MVYKIMKYFIHNIWEKFHSMCLQFPSVRSCERKPCMTRTRQRRSCTPSPCPHKHRIFCDPSDHLPASWASKPWKQRALRDRRLSKRPSTVGSTCCAGVVLVLCGTWVGCCAGVAVGAGVGVLPSVLLTVWDWVDSLHFGYCSGWCNCSLNKMLP